MSPRRLFLPLAVVALSVLTACGASTPPATEVAHEMIDTLTELPLPVRDCMHAKVDDFGLTEEQSLGFKNFDDVATKAAGDNQLAIDILKDFEDALASCN